MERILCVKIASRGDLVLAGPAFARLREQRPDAQIDLIVGESCLDVAEHLPFFDHLRTINDANLFSRDRGRRLKAALRMVGMFRTPPGGGRYDEIAILHRDWRYGLIARLAGIRVRRGFASRQSFLSHPYEPAEGEHHSEQYTRMMGCKADQLRRGTWRFHAGERELALERVRRLGFEGGEWVALGFGGGRNVKTTTSLKTWPLPRFLELAAALHAAGRRVVWLGDRFDAQQLGMPTRGLNLAGQLSVPETAAVISVSSHVVANDSMILHLADAIGVPAVGLFGPTDARHYGPRDSRSAAVWPGKRLECAPCHLDGYFPPCPIEHRCMTDISVAMVLEHVCEPSE